MATRRRRTVAVLAQPPLYYRLEVYILVLHAFFRQK
jgi:hypothetical protein